MKKYFKAIWLCCLVLSALGVRAQTVIVETNTAPYAETAAGGWESNPCRRCRASIPAGPYHQPRLTPVRGRPPVRLSAAGIYDREASSARRGGSAPARVQVIDAARQANASAASISWA